MFDIDFKTTSTTTIVVSKLADEFEFEKFQ